MSTREDNVRKKEDEGRRKAEEEREEEGGKREHFKRGSEEVETKIHEMFSKSMQSVYKHFNLQEFCFIKENESERLG